MPANKSALLRYRIIDSCLTNTLRKFPTMDFIIDKIEEQNHTSLSTSMFTKDIQNMRTIYGAPIKFDRCNKGYHYTEPDFTIREFPLTLAEIEALDFSTALFQQLKNSRMFNHFESAINKVIDGYRINKMIGKSEKQILQVEEPVQTEGNEWLEVILQAIVESSCLKISYKAFGKEGKDHEFSSYLLKEYHNRWYVIGYSKRADNTLVLALDRITGVVSSKGRYISDDKFIPADFFKYCFGITQIHTAEPQTIVLSFNPNQAAYIISQPLHASQKVILENEHEVQIELNVYVTQELKMAILSYGQDVKVLAPKSLKTELKKVIEKMSINYS